MLRGLVWSFTVVKLLSQRGLSKLGILHRKGLTDFLKIIMDCCPPSHSSCSTNLESVKIYFWVVKHTLSSVVKINILIDIIWIFVFASWSSCGQRVEVWPRGLDDNLATGTTPTLRRLLASSSPSSPWAHHHRRHQRGGRQRPWWEGHWRLSSVSASISIVAPFVIASVF